MSGYDHNKVIRLFYAAQDGDRIVAARHKGKMERLAIKWRKQPVACRHERSWMIISLTCHIAGCAAIWDQGSHTVAVLGTEPSLGFWDWPYAMKETGEALDCLDPPDTLLRKVHIVRAWRISLPRLRWHIVERYPSLREGIKEPLALKPRSGGLWLGGVVWKPETYRQKDGRKFLGF